MSAVTTDREQQATLVWYRRRWVLATVAAVVVATITVVTDLPQHSTRRSQIAADTSVMKSINGNLRSCDYAVSQSFGIYRAGLQHRIPTSEQGQVPGLLRDDAQACSFTNPDIYNLSDLSIPGSPSGKRLQELVGTASTWASSDALLAIEAIQALWAAPHDGLAARHLATAERQLQQDRSTAFGDVRAAEQLLGGARLPAVDMPAVPSH